METVSVKFYLQIVSYSTNPESYHSVIPILV